MNATKVKSYCVVCDCMVVLDGHEMRCRPKTFKGWDVVRKRAWFGDTVHRLDVQWALRYMEVAPSQWESVAQLYTTNEAQAKYVRQHVAALEGRSDHTVGTHFEASYVGVFRHDYLRVMFPTFFEQILAAWAPPPLFDEVEEQVDYIAQLEAGLR